MDAWTHAQRIIADRSLTASERLTALRLLSLGGAGTAADLDDGSLGLSRRQIERCLASLLAANWLAKDGSTFRFVTTIDMSVVVAEPSAPMPAPPTPTPAPTVAPVSEETPTAAPAPSKTRRRETIDPAKWLQQQERDLAESKRGVRPLIR